MKIVSMGLGFGVLCLIATGCESSGFPPLHDSQTTDASMRDAGDSARLDGGADGASDGSEGALEPLRNDLVFRSNPDGYSFQNYGNDEAENLSARELVRMFGADVCQEGTLADGDCILVPQAAAWMASENDGMDGGHCEGMSVSSLLFARGLIAHESFGGANTFALPFANNGLLQREIAYWFVTQNLPAVEQASVKLPPRDLIPILRRSLMAGSREAYEFAIYQRGLVNGHAITPYGIREVSSTQTEVLVYDNNFPNEERILTINPETNEWRYFAASDPREEAALYEGDATSLTLRLEPTSLRLGQHDCFFCNDYRGTAQNATLQVRTTAERSSDRLRAVASWENGLMSNRLPVVPHRGLDWALQETVRRYRFTDGEALILPLQGPASGQSLPLDLNFVGQGFSVRTENLVLGVGVIDRLVFEADRAAWAYETQGTTSPSFELNVELPGADYRVRVQVLGDANGHSLSLAYDLAMQRWQLDVDGEGETRVSLEVHRFDRDTDIVFSHASIELSQGHRALFDLSAWAGDGSALRMRVDQDRDGTPDLERDLSDEN